VTNKRIHLIARTCLLIAGLGYTVSIFGQSAPPKKSAFAAQLEANFAKWDRNKDGQLSSKEIDDAIIDGENRGKSAAVLAALKLAERATKTPLPPLTRDYLQTAAAAPEAANGDPPKFEKLYFAALTRIEKADRTLFSTGTPHLKSLHQGRTGDCFCLAPLGALLNRDAKAVAKMFKLMPDSAYQVTFGDGRKVRVNALTDAEIALSASTEHDGAWVNIYEKAVAEVRNQKLPDDQKNTVAADAISHGGSTRSIMELVTGHAVKYFACRAKEEKDASIGSPPSEERQHQLQSVLQRALKEKMIVCASTPKSVKVPGINPGHAYAVLDFDGEKNEIQIWNPHGNTFRPKGAAGLEFGYPTADGIFTVPVREFMQIYSGFSHETREPVKSRSK
jgi:hypothetical protein